MIRLLISVFVVTLTFTAGNAWSANLYRYVDADGVTVLDRTIPPEFVQNGYTILNEQGSILKVVPRALTEEEKTILRAEEQRAAAQAARDAELRSLYRAPDDVDVAMVAWIKRLNIEISIKQSQVQTKRLELLDLQGTAADIERSGNSISDELYNQINAVQAGIDSDKAGIDALVVRIVADIKTFESAKTRLSQLTGIAAKPTAAVLEAHQLYVPALDSTADVK